MHIVICACRRQVNANYLLLKTSRKFSELFQDKNTGYLYRKVSIFLEMYINKLDRNPSRK